LCAPEGQSRVARDFSPWKGVEPSKKAPEGRHWRAIFLDIAPPGLKKLADFSQDLKVLATRHCPSGANHASLNKTQDAIFDLPTPDRQKPAKSWRKRGLSHLRTPASRSDFSQHPVFPLFFAKNRGRSQTDRQGWGKKSTYSKTHLTLCAARTSDPK
jgi:hypothetical protein